MDQYSKILATYRQKKSLRATAKSLDISNQTVRRVLITAGLYTSPRVERIRELSAAGMPPQDIAEMLGITYGAVVASMPYPHGPRADWPVSRNALAIRKTRAKKPPKEAIQMRDRETLLPPKGGVPHE